MKRTSLLIALVLAAFSASAQDIQLPAPQKNAEMTLYQALQNRASNRSFSSAPISDQILSDLLWAAEGINREDGRLTAPTAMNTQEIRLYVCRADGAYEYIAKDNKLLKVSGKDLRADVAGPQAGVANAPLFLVISCDLNRYSRKSDHTKVMGAVDVGYVSQNICLACVALGLSTVPRAGMNQEVLRKELGIAEDHLLLINHPVGYKK